MKITLERFMYAREEFLALRQTGQGVKHPIADELMVLLCGCRARAKLKAKRWRYKPFLPLIVMGNVNSLTNKRNELVALVRNQRGYCE